MFTRIGGKVKRFWKEKYSSTLQIPEKILEYTNEVLALHYFPPTTSPLALLSHPQGAKLPGGPSPRDDVAFLLDDHERHEEDN